jgi:hypothetical protein
LSSNFNANLFELKAYAPLNVNVYYVELTPAPENAYYFYQVLGKLAKKLTQLMKTAVISDAGNIKVLEVTLPEEDLQQEIELTDIATYVVKLEPIGKEVISFEDAPFEYGRLVSKIVDLALVHLADDYYKYSVFSPYIMERGEGYFDASLRKRIGVEDGRRFYRGLRVFDGIPHLIINREIELRSWKNLLNELKILATWWVRTKPNIETIDFYDPPKDFVKFVNWIFLNRRANVKAYSSRPVYIREITWDYRADSNVLEGGMSPCEYHKKAQGITIEDRKQPLVKWEITTSEGEKKYLFHVPELLVVGHTFKDISMRVSKSQISQVFDILHPHCGDQLRRILEIQKKIDTILREHFQSIYPDKLEFSVLPKVVNNNVCSSAITLEFKNKELNIEPPFGINFYRQYTQTATFFKQIPKTKLLVVCEEKYLSFVEKLKTELESRNNSEICISHCLEIDLEKTLPSFDLLLTITDDDNDIHCYKKTVINDLGLAHQNVTPNKTLDECIPQLAMQITLKLGGQPWVLKTPEKNNVLSVYAYRNPFNAMKCFLFNLMKPTGEIVFQSKPFDDAQTLLEELKLRIKNMDNLLVLSSFIYSPLQESLIEEIGSLIPKFMFIQINQMAELRLFTTFKPVIKTPRRRRRLSSIFPIEAYEAVPEGTILSASDTEHYLLTTASTKVRTYYRGCPTPIRLNIIKSEGVFNLEKLLKYILSLSLVSETSGHETKLPAPLYYMKKYAAYVNEYGLPSNEKIFKTLFYV